MVNNSSQSQINGTVIGNTLPDGDDSDSGSGSDSSDDETKYVPSAIKNRFASGGLGRKKTASQPAGW